MASELAYSVRVSPTYPSFSRGMPMRVVSLSALLAMGGAVHAASFDCSKAASATEKLICANARISDLDEHLGRYYGAARTELGRGAACLMSTQRDWLRKVRNTCKDS